MGAKRDGKTAFAIWAAQMDAHRADCAQIARSKLRMVFDQTRDKYKTDLEQDRIEVLYDWLARCSGAISPLASHCQDAGKKQVQAIAESLMKRTSQTLNYLA